MTSFSSLNISLYSVAAAICHMIAEGHALENANLYPKKFDERLSPLTVCFHVSSCVIFVSLHQESLSSTQAMMFLFRLVCIVYKSSVELAAQTRMNQCLQITPVASLPRKRSLLFFSAFSRLVDFISCTILYLHF